MAPKDPYIPSTVAHMSPLHPDQTEKKQLTASQVITEIGTNVHPMS